jgi:hypothetical protein
MNTNLFFETLWENYIRITPSAKLIHEVFEGRGEHVQNDHIAIRTFNDARVNINAVAVPVKAIGYVEKGEYFFKEKKLFARHYEHPDGNNYPKIFISELLLEQCSEELQSIVRGILDEIPYDKFERGELIFQGRLWDIHFKNYELLQRESEYASWMYVYGFCANHFTVLVNALKSFNGLEEVNDFLKSKGFKLNGAGGEIKGTPEQLLEQSSTIADLVPVSFDEGVRNIPGCYYEFARRYKMENGEFYQGFIAASADKIFESTNVSIVENSQKKEF